MQELIKNTEEKMGKTLDALDREYKSVRAGRANVSVLDKVVVDEEVEHQHHNNLHHLINHHQI